MIAGVRMKKIPTEQSDKYAVQGETLRRMIQEDKAAGLIPFYVRTEHTHPLLQYSGLQKYSSPWHISYFAALNLKLLKDP